MLGNCDNIMFSWLDFLAVIFMLDLDYMVQCVAYQHEFSPKHNKILINWHGGVLCCLWWCNRYAKTENWLVNVQKWYVVHGFFSFFFLLSLEIFWWIYQFYIFFFTATWKWFLIFCWDLNFRFKKNALQFMLIGRIGYS